MDIQVAEGIFDAFLESAIYNFRPGYTGNIKKFWLATAKMQAGETVRPRILIIGTSKQAGNACGIYDGTDWLTDGTKRNKHKFICDGLTQLGVPNTRQSVMPANGLIQAAYIKYEPRIEFAADWVIQTNTANDSLGGGLFYCANGATGALRFKPEGFIDTVEVYHSQGVGRGEFTVSDGATVVGTIDQYSATTPALVKTTFTMPRGSGKILNFNRTTTRALACDIMAIVAYDSTVPSIDIVNGGRAGSTTARTIVNTNFWNSMGMINKMAPDLTFIALGANDMGSQNNVPVATFVTNMGTIINQARLTGDVVIVIESLGTRVNAKWGTAAFQQSYVDALYKLAKDYDCPLINENMVIGDFDSGQSATYVSDTNFVHENVRANTMLAKKFVRVITA